MRLLLEEGRGPKGVLRRELEGRQTPPGREVGRRRGVPASSSHCPGMPAVVALGVREVERMIQ